MGMWFSSGIPRTGESVSTKAGWEPGWVLKNFAIVSKNTGPRTTRNGISIYPALTSVMQGRDRQLAPCRDGGRRRRHPAEKPEARTRAHQRCGTRGRAPRRRGIRPGEKNRQKTQRPFTKRNLNEHNRKFKYRMSKTICFKNIGNCG